LNPKSIGTTPSERFLARLCDSTFLSLWSYPNVYRDQGKTGTGDGKEMCDLLVVCGDDVLLFSDKSVAFKGDVASPTSWARWCKRAVIRSADQLHGAARWLDSPDRLFLDRSCTQPLLLSIPPPAARQVHRIVVARGSGQACRAFFGSGSGSLVILPAISGTQHIDPHQSLSHPFAIGDIDPAREFVHVLDDTTLELLLSELDTISDFVRYLVDKEAFVRSGNLISAAGEEELLGYYLGHMNSSGNHAFTTPDGRDVWRAGEYASISEGIWQQTSSRPEFLRKKEADRISYQWDQMIERFAGHLLGGTARTAAREPASITQHERALRLMALETRFERRAIAEQILEAIRLGSPDQNYARIIGLREPLEARTVYVFLQVPFNEASGAPDYEEYRDRRATLAYAYCMGIKARFPAIPRTIGIAVEPPATVGPAGPFSEDLVMVEPPKWTAELQEEADELCAMFGIMDPEKLTTDRIRQREYPEADFPGPPGSGSDDDEGDADAG